eukprot:13946897-Alexandrium_andersonii.AAC.1
MCIRDRPSTLRREARPHASLRPIKVLVVPGKREVAPVDHALHVPARAVEATSAGFAPAEAKLSRVSAQRAPQRDGAARVPRRL